MRYQSNLRVPDLTSHFKLRKPPMQIMGHDIPSDPDFEPDCGFWSHDEAAILYNCAARIKGPWVDIGARFGWTAAYIAASGASVTLVDPHLRLQARTDRMEQNIYAFWRMVDEVWAKAWQGLSADMADQGKSPFSGFVIDGCHDAPEPLKDAQGCARLAADTAVILLHDAMGKPVRDAALWLMDNGWNGRFFWTPNGVIACWRGEFVPPDHLRDPAIDWRCHEANVYADIPKERFS